MKNLGIGAGFRLTKRCKECYINAVPSSFSDGSHLRTVMCFWTGVPMKTLQGLEIPSLLSTETEKL